MKKDKQEYKIIANHPTLKYVTTKDWLSSSEFTNKINELKTLGYDIIRVYQKGIYYGIKKGIYYCKIK